MLLQLLETLTPLAYLRCTSGSKDPMLKALSEWSLVAIFNTLTVSIVAKSYWFVKICSLLSTFSDAYLCHKYSSAAPKASKVHGLSSHASVPNPVISSFPADGPRITLPSGLIAAPSKSARAALKQ